MLKSQKYILPFLISCVLMVACSPPSSEDAGSIMQYDDSPSLSEEEGKNKVDTDQKSRFIPDSTQVLSAEVGLYTSAAIIVLNWYPTDTNGMLPVDGYYFYTEHQENIDLNGQYDPTSKKLKLTESVKDKETGKMVMAFGAGKSYWAPPEDPSDKQTLNWNYLFSDHPKEIDLQIEHTLYKYIHTIEFYNGGEAFDTATVEDELYISYLNDELFAFDLSVVRANTHMGHVAGVAQKKGDVATFNTGRGPDQCELEFKFKDAGEEIKITEISCQAYHGALAYFDGTYNRYD